MAACFLQPSLSSTLLRLRHRQLHPRFPSPLPPLPSSSWGTNSTTGNTSPPLHSLCINRSANLNPSAIVCRAHFVATMTSSDGQIVHDLAIGLVTMVASFSTLKFWDFLATRKVFSQEVSRKLVHISVGMIFMLFWSLFSDSAWAPYIAISSVAINTLRILAIGFGVLKDDVTVKAMARNGNPEELIKGPFFYGITIVFTTTCIWRTSPLAPIIIANMCAGDGFADLVGRRFGSAKLPYNKNKSYIGSLAMLIFGFIFSIGYEYYFSYFGFYDLNMKLVIYTFVISLVSTFVESLPISTRLDDNLTVPLTSFVVGRILL